MSRGSFWFYTICAQKVMRSYQALSVFWEIVEKDLNFFKFKKLLTSFNFKKLEALTLTTYDFPVRFIWWMKLFAVQFGKVGFALFWWNTNNRNASVKNKSFLTTNCFCLIKIFQSFFPFLWLCHPSQNFIVEFAFAWHRLVRINTANCRLIQWFIENASDRQLFSTREPMSGWLVFVRLFDETVKKLWRKNLLISNVAENCIDTLFMILIDISALKRRRRLFSHVVCNAME